MFISKEELRDLWTHIHRLEKDVAELMAEKELLAMASIKPRRTISPEGRANISAGLRASHERRRAASGAME